MLPLEVYFRSTNQVARLLNSITELVHALLGQSVCFAKYLFGIILDIVIMTLCNPQIQLPIHVSSE